MITLVGFGANASPEAAFWVWFQKHSNDIYHFEKDREKEGLKR